MNIKEYEKIKDMNYLEYCDYLQSKYGIGQADYMDESYNKNPKCTRTKEGLFAHHKMEDHAKRLSKKEDAKKYPFEWQRKENIVYCDLLEHLLLHVLICKYPAEKSLVGIGGVIVYLVPELNDVYSGWTATQDWQKKCHDKIINDKQVYLLILQQFIDFVKYDETLSLFVTDESFLCQSLNDRYGIWNSDNNKMIYDEISEMWEES